MKYLLWGAVYCVVAVAIIAAGNEAVKIAVYLHTPYQLPIED